MMKILLTFFAMTTAALAQQPTSVEDIQRLLPALEAQRNQALTNHAIAEATISKLTEENTKLKAEIEELKKKLPADK